ncbi:zinc finger, CCHC-type containing protein [Tanacetum coccineum]
MIVGAETVKGIKIKGVNVGFNLDGLCPRVMVQWIKMKALLEQQGLAAALKELPATTIAAYDNVRVNLNILMSFTSWELQKMTKEKSDGREGLYVKGRSGQRDMEHGKGSAWFMSQGRSTKLNCYICQSKEHLKRDCPKGSYHMTYKRDYLFDIEEYDGGNVLFADDKECRVRGTSKVQVQMRDGSRGFYREDAVGKDQAYKGFVVVLSGTRRANCVYILDGQTVTRKSLKGRKQLGEYHIGWKIKTGNVLDSCNQRSTQQCTNSGIVIHLGVAGIQQQNGLVGETNVTLLAKVCCFLIQSGMSKVFWADDTIMSTYLVNRSPSSVIGFKTPVDMLKFFGCIASIKKGMLEPVKVKCIFLAYIEGIMGNKLWRLDDVTSKVVLYRNIGFNESGEYKKTFIGSGVACDRKQQSARELFRYKEDSNEAAFAVAVVEKIYTHESLTLNDTVAYDVISKWNVGLQEYIDVWSDVYVLTGMEYQVVCTKPDIASSDVAEGTLNRVREAELTLVAVVATDALIEAIPGPRFQYWLKLLRVKEG